MGTMGEDRIKFTAEHDLIAQKLGVGYASTGDNAQDHIILADRVQQFIDGLNKTVNVIEWIQANLADPEVFGLIFSPAIETIQKAGDSIKDIDLALKILKVGHYTIHNSIVHQEQEIIDRHFLGLHTSQESTEAIALKYEGYEGSIPQSFINAET